MGARHVVAQWSFRADLAISFWSKKSDSEYRRHEIDCGINVKGNFVQCPEATKHSMTLATSGSMFSQ